MLYEYLLTLAVLATINLSEAKVTCDDKDVARDKFEYYTLWYRFRHGLLFWTTRKICALTEEESKFVCAQVAQACFKTLNDVPLEVIEAAINTKPSHCKKEEFTTPKKDSDDFKGGLKKMFGCPKYTVAGQEVTSFFVSYGGSHGTALIFDRDSTKNMNIDAKPPEEAKGQSSFIKLANYVSGLALEKPRKDDDQNKETQNKGVQNKGTQNKGTQNESTQNTENHSTNTVTA